MSNRHLSILLIILLLCGLGLGVTVMLRGPGEVESSLIKLIQAQQEVLAEQAALRIRDSLQDVQVRLSIAGEQLGARLTESPSAEPLSDTLERLIHHTDEASGVTLAILNQQGRVLAIDPRASAAKRAAIDSFTQKDPDFRVSLPLRGASRVLIHRKTLLGNDSRLLTTRLNDTHILAATINLEVLGAKNFNEVMGPRDIRALLLDERDGSVLVEVNPNPETVGRWVAATARVPRSQLSVEVAASREALAPQIRRPVRVVVYIALSMVLLLIGAMFILVLLNRRAHQESLDRTRALLHQDKLATLGLMAASTAHEIRNAITVASLQLQVAAAVSEDEQIIEHLDKASHSVNRLAKLAQQLSNYGQRNTDAESRFELSSAVQEAIEIVQPKTKTRAQVHLELHPGLYVNGSRNEIVQVLVNLVLNAVDATESNNGRAVYIRTMREGSQAIASIIDEGAGIERSARDRIFEPFFSTKSHDNTSSGTGIGLWLSAEIIARHHGTLRAENLDAGGAQFQLSLRIDDPPE